MFVSRETGLRWFGWFRCGYGGLYTCMWFGANMTGRGNKNAFKFLLQLLILSQKHILCVKKVVWDGLEVVLMWFGVVWRWFEVVWGVSTDRFIPVFWIQQVITSPHFLKLLCICTGGRSSS